MACLENGSLATLEKKANDSASSFSVKAAPAAPDLIWRDILLTQHAKSCSLFQSQSRHPKPNLQQDVKNNLDTVRLRRD